MQIKKWNMKIFFWKFNVGHDHIRHLLHVIDLRHWIVGIAVPTKKIQSILLAHKNKFLNFHWMTWNEKKN